MHLFLVGPPGIGKSTLAPVLAASLAAAVLEIDGVIERRTRRSNRRTIEERGHEHFRDLESGVLAGLAPSPAWCVVDTGAGTPLRAENRARMRELGIIVGLRGSLADRGRRAGYGDCDVTFDVDGATTEATAAAIVDWLLRARGVRIDVGAGTAYPITIRAGALDRVGEHLVERGWRGRVALVTEPAVRESLGPRVRSALERSGLGVAMVSAPRGEASKSIRAVARMWSDLATAGIGRDGGVVALGGGAIGDAAGFAAATYLRGVRVAQVPTTLLAMVDASIGGKTAIDIPAGKNLVGAFHQPDAVIIDVEALASLPRRERASGLAEVVKAAFLVDRASVAHVERAIPRVVAGDAAATATAIALAAEVKASVVTADPTEQGLRALLNFGHTMGHAYESASGYRIRHGEAVAVGLVYACALAEVLDLAPAALRGEVERLLAMASLPIRARIPEAAWALLRRDKKVRAGKVRWILPRRIGRFSEVTDVDGRALRSAARILEGT